jgi:hypothetical protein
MHQNRRDNMDVDAHHRKIIHVSRSINVVDAMAVCNMIMTGVTRTHQVSRKKRMFAILQS